MKPMNKSIIILLLIILTAGCKDYIQIFETKSTNVKKSNDQFVFENDSISIVYSFWYEKGLMLFSIENKTSKPIYIDWKKSSYIDNQVKLNYWNDESTTTTSSVTSTSHYDYYESGTTLTPNQFILSEYLETGKSESTSLAISKTKKPERITFVPPRSITTRTGFFVYPIKYFKFGKSPKYVEVESQKKAGKTIKVYEKQFGYENSPLACRNFLTFSFSEDFKEEFYVDNDFYISKVQEMELWEFQEYKYDETGKRFIRDSNGYPKLFSRYRKESSFYIHIDRYYRVRGK
jgi:hypothetical protein